MIFLLKSLFLFVAKLVKLFVVYECTNNLLCFICWGLFLNNACSLLPIFCMSWWTNQWSAIPTDAIYTWQTDDNGRWTNYRILGYSLQSQVNRGDWLRANCLLSVPRQAIYCIYHKLMYIFIEYILDQQLLKSIYLGEYIR